MTETAETQSHSRLMDAVYRNQRHIYDLTRKYYLLGRDHMLGQLDVPEDGSVLEVACGTGRNLALAARLYPHARLYGFDISAQMLKSAQATMARKGLENRVALAEGDATDFDPAALFGVRNFDRVFISYSVSMIPVWKEAVAHAMEVVAPGGELHVVDFGQQARLPSWFGNALHGWLARFHVTPRADLETVMGETARDVGGSLAFTSLYRDYARYGVIRLPAE
ncbi:MULTISPECIES: class I SAM-dependent methyltransferase [unclassified Roseitalea]|uniref:class I SAM-dependent methyltransferase n=1 Tax=unclassified Roseitalea TaxID=2639107 RepID=UPI00273D0CC0|nr:MULTISPECIES: class I SAM-dependent methyltransferase [unclassified Roseitalea]